MNLLENYSKEVLEEVYKTTLALEYVGIHTENTKWVNDELGIPTILHFYFSVPETSTIDDHEKLKTADDLISVAKEELLDIIKDLYIDAYGKDEFGSEFLDEFKEDLNNNPSKYVKFFAKVRKGEVWNKEKGEETIKKITSEIKKASGYKEV